MTEEPPHKRTKLDASDKKKEKFLPTYGNYRGYYSKRTAASGLDQRLSLVSEDWVKGKVRACLLLSWVHDRNVLTARGVLWQRVLDIGCNTGFITIQLAQTYAPYRVTGVDIDEHLISRAEKQGESLCLCLSKQVISSTHTLFILFQSSLHSPAKVPFQTTRQHLLRPTTFPCLLPAPSASYLSHLVHGSTGSTSCHPKKLPRPHSARTASSLADRLCRAKSDSFPATSALSMPTGSLKMLEMTTRAMILSWRAFPSRPRLQHQKLRLATTSRLSVLKWIHINDGDQGLKDFFAKAFKTLRPSGKFVFEPQPWSSYKKCKRMSPKLKANYEGLRLRPEQFGNIMCEEIGFERVEQLGEPGHGGFQRGVFVAYKPKGAWV